MTTAFESKLMFWIEPSTKFTIEGAIHGQAPHAIEVHYFGTSMMPNAIRTLVLAEGESAAGVWQRAIEAMLKLKRQLPFNPSQGQHGLFRFRYDGTISQDEADAHDRYRNQRHYAVWAAWHGPDSEVRAAAKAALRVMAVNADAPLLEQALLTIHLAALSGLIGQAELRALDQWAEKCRLAIPLDDLADQNSLGRKLALQALALLEAEEPSVASAQ